MLNKLKSLLLDDTAYMAFLLVFVAVASFGLGRMSVNEPLKETATVAQTVVNHPKNQPLPTVSSSSIVGFAELQRAASSTIPAEQNFVASKSGTKFHAPHCPGAKQIKDTNKIYFATETEAEAAGYTRAANCKF